MKIYSQVACMVLILVVLLSGCGTGASTPPADTAVVPPATTAAPLPEATQPPPTVPAPTQTPLPAAPTLPPPVDTPLPTAAPATPVSSPVATSVDLPQAGRWHGGGADLLTDFLITVSDGQVFVTDVGILWLGPGLCELNARYDVQLPLDENGFKMTYNRDIGIIDAVERNVAFEFYSTAVSPQLIQGIFHIKYSGCGEQKISWRMEPKTGASQ